MRILLVEKPKIPVLYVADYPSGAFVTGTGVKNAALTFNSCIYKASDVPLRTRRENIHFARPITCFEWLGRIFSRAAEPHRA